MFAAMLRSYGLYKGRSDRFDPSAFPDVKVVVLKTVHNTLVADGPVLVAPLPNVFGMFTVNGPPDFGGENDHFVLTVRK